MKKIIAILLVLAFAFTFTACDDGDNWVPSGMKLASSDAVDYKLYVPSSWTVDISTGIVSAYVSDTDRSNITMIAFNLENEDNYMTVDEYWEKYEADLITTFPDLVYVSPSDFSTDEEEITEETTAEEETTEEATYSESGDKKSNPISMVLGTTTKANKYYYKATVTGSQMMYMQVIAIRAGVAYLFTYTATPDNFSTHLEDVNSILENLSFDN